MTEHIVRDQIFISKLTEIIRTNLGNENFNAKELADQSGMNLYSLNRRLNAITNKTARQFIRETRLLQALELLRNEELTAAEVAYKVGFSSPAYFNTCFHEYFGYPPGSVNKVDLKKIEELNPVQRQENQKTKTIRWPTLILISSGILSLAVLFYLVFNGLLKSSSANTGSNKKSEEKSIAVLPFKNLSSDPSNQYFIDGVMEEILTNLSSIHDLRVLSRTSVEQFRGDVSSTSDIGKKLKVDYLVEGSGQKNGNDFVLRVQLIRVINERHLWAQSYKQEIFETSDIIGIQSQVSQSIASEIEAKITPEEKKIIEKIPTKSLMAHDLFARGLQEMNKLGAISDHGEAAKKVEFLYHSALKYDSAFAPAYVGLANVYWIKIEKERNFASDDILKNYQDSMLLLTNIAISLDDKLSEAYFVRGGCQYNMGNERQALEDWDNAIRYNPNNFSSYWCKGWFYESHDLIKSVENYQKAALIDHGPKLPEILTRMGGDYYMTGFPESGNKALAEALKVDGDSLKYLDNCIYYMAENQGAYQNAAQYFEKRFQADSTNDLILLRLGFYNSLLGKYKESLGYYERYVSGSYKSIISNSVERRKMESHIGYVYMQNGYRKEANNYLNKSIDNYKRFIKSAPEHEKRIYEYLLAGVYAGKGDKEKAYDYLMLLGKEHCFTLNDVTLIKNDPLFKSIRSEPEFQKIVKDMEGKYQNEHERVRKWMEEQGILY
jgi:TolB-like protein/AraC-like DNA-binding protein/Tfp pilus assembly protein PilF